MPEEVLKTYIEGDYSVLVAIIGVIASIAAAWLTAKATSRLESKKFNHRLIENLYEKRYETYTKLLEITQEIGKDKKAIECHEDAKVALKNWQKKTGGYLLLSEKSLEAFNLLKDLLRKNPEKQSEYSDEQRCKLWEARNSFRGALRDDFDFFHSSEKKIK